MHRTPSASKQQGTWRQHTAIVPRLPHWAIFRQLGYFVILLEENSNMLYTTHPVRYRWLAAEKNFWRLYGRILDDLLPLGTLGDTNLSYFWHVYANISSKNYLLNLYSACSALSSFLRIMPSSTADWWRGLEMQSKHTESGGLKLTSLCYFQDAFTSEMTYTVLGWRRMGC